ncbi:MAG: hypothetical protein AB8H80_02985 [Planctomycetota bacterium]
MIMFRNLFSTPAASAASLLALALFAVTPACSEAESNKDDGKGDSAAASPLAAAVLKTDPGEALTVLAAKEAGAGKGIVVHGRVQDITDGFAMFKLIDKSLDYCGEINKEDKCGTPWDYCCDAPEEIIRTTLLVELRDDKGMPHEVDALPNTRLLDHVKVTGDMIKDEHGNLVLLAKGMFRVERPTLGDHVTWPE